MQHARTVLDRTIAQALMPLINIGISGAIAAMLLDLVSAAVPGQTTAPAEAVERSNALW